MALENLTPVTRKEAILAGYPLDPVTREEYFLEEAVNFAFPIEMNASNQIVVNGVAIETVEGVEAFYAKHPIVKLVFSETREGINCGFNRSADGTKAFYHFAILNTAMNGFALTKVGIV